MDLEWIERDGDEYPVVSGELVGDEEIVDGLRVWSPWESKAAAVLANGRELPVKKGDSMLYLGGGAGTTPSYFADLGVRVYAVEFAATPGSRLVDIAETRNNLFPLIFDARKPEMYRGFLEEVDFLYQDVATRGQGDVALKNTGFLKSGGVAWICVKARSEDVAEDPESIYREVANELESEFEVRDILDLSPFYSDHAVIIAKKR